MSLLREFKIKWWTAYSVDLCSQEAVLQFIQNRHLLQRSIQQLSKGASSSAQLTVPATPSLLKPASSTSKITTVAADDNDDAAQFIEFLRFKAFQQQIKQQSAHSPTSSQDSSTEPLDVWSSYKSVGKPDCKGVPGETLGQPVNPLVSPPVRVFPVRWSRWSHVELH
ncbi:hypothetical protein M9H77_21712 [Catharanthus roseus]|uniref:Uncharacterized protein n=1 Tax=Catharanthus roseus TaxID=4058 RepID=A0ACC0AP83_CATRO|nr:hypothetical protein M9H77_21712 [Catharanthus roseus]